MSYQTNYYKSGEPYHSFRCSSYENRTVNCTIHHISDKVLYQLVLRSIQRLSSHIIADERGFAEELKSKWEAQANGKPQKQKDELQIINRRLNELDRLIGSLYETANSAASPSGRPTVRRCCAPRNAKPSTAGRNNLPIIIVSNPSRKPEKQYKTKEDDTMEKFITDERTGLRYELVGDYYLIAGEDELEGRPIDIWGQRHLRYIRKHKVSLYAELLTTGKLNDYLADLNEQAEAMFSRLVKQLSEKEGVTEALKAENQMLWVQRMNNIRSAAMEIVANDLIYC